MKMYGDLVGWYRLMTPPEDYEKEAAIYIDCLRRARRPVREVLELGCGAGHNARWMKTAFQLTLVDINERMLALSRELNPECRHVVGDMRSLALEETFDAVFVHDAVAYMTSQEDLRAVMATARRHLRPGGAALFVPDDVRDEFEEWTDVWEKADGGRHLRFEEHNQDPNPADEQAESLYRWTMTEDGETRVVEETHTFGMFDSSTWLELLAAEGFMGERVQVEGELAEEVGALFLGVVQ